MAVPGMIVGDYLGDEAQFERFGIGLAGERRRSLNQRVDQRPLRDVPRMKLGDLSIFSDAHFHDALRGIRPNGDRRSRLFLGRKRCRCRSSGAAGLEMHAPE